jgi:type II secretory pathway component GspD/PulD (secretin)
MAKRFFAVLLLVSLAGGVLSVAAPAQESAEKDAQQQASSEEGKTENRLTNFPDNFPETRGFVELRPRHRTRISLKLEAVPSREAYESIAKQAGIEVIFDPDYNPRPITVQFDGLSVQDALKMAAYASDTFWRPVTENSIFVAADNTGKRREFQQQALKVFYLPNRPAPTDMQDVVNCLRTILEIPRIQQVPSEYAVLVRGTPEQIALAEKIVNELTGARQKDEGQYRLEYKIHETMGGAITASRTYSLLVEPEETGRLRIGPAEEPRPDRDKTGDKHSEKDKENKERASASTEFSKDIKSRIRRETEHTVSVLLTVSFVDAHAEKHGEPEPAPAADSSQNIAMETSATLELGVPTIVGGFQDPATKRGFQIEATATRIKHPE